MSDELRTRPWGDVNRKVKVAAWTLPFMPLFVWLGARMGMPAEAASAFALAMSALAGGIIPVAAAYLARELKELRD